MQSVQGNRPMTRAKIASMWWIVLMRGIAGVLLGGALFSQPALTQDVLAEFMAIYWLFDATFMMIAAGVARPIAGNWWRWMLARGVLGVLAAFVVLGALEANEDLAPIMVFVLGAQAIAAGIIDLVTNFGLRQEAPDEWAMAISAVMQVVFGVLLIISPMLTLQLIGMILGGVALAAGIGMVLYSFRMRKI